jgi:hypothetical protein
LALARYDRHHAPGYAITGARFQQSCRTGYDKALKEGTFAPADCAA